MRCRLARKSGLLAKQGVWGKGDKRSPRGSNSQVNVKNKRRPLFGFGTRLATSAPQANQAHIMNPLGNTRRLHIRTSVANSWVLFIVARYCVILSEVSDLSGQSGCICKQAPSLEGTGPQCTVETSVSAQAGQMVTGVVRWHGHDSNSKSLKKRIMTRAMV